MSNEEKLSTNHIQDKKQEVKGKVTRLTDVNERRL